MSQGQPLLTKKWDLLHIDKMKASRKKWRENNKELDRKWSVENKEYNREYHKKYLQTENGKIKNRAKVRKYIAKLHKVNETYTQNEWNDKLDNTNGICPKCGKFFGKDKLELDHIIPISKVVEGFEYTINDIQPLCRSCNASKGDKI